MPATPYKTSFDTNEQRDKILRAVQAALQIVPTCPTRIAPGQLLTATLSSASPSLDVSSLVNGFINVAWTAKDVIFNDASWLEVPHQGDIQGDDVLRDFAAPPVSGAQPFPPPLPKEPTAPSTTPPGVLGQLFGGVAVPSLRVHASFRWFLRNARGQLMTEGKNYVATQGLQSPAVALAVPPIFKELRLDTLRNPIGEIVCLYCEVTLWLEERVENQGDPIHRVTFTLGGVPFMILPLLVPTVVALFREPNFQGTLDSAVALVVPEHSPFASAGALINELKRIENVLSAVRGLADIAGFLLGISELVSALPEQPRIRLVSADVIHRLEDITVKPRPWYAFWQGDRNMNDNVRSVIIIGQDAGAAKFIVEFYINDWPIEQPKPQTDQGWLYLRAGVDTMLFRIIRNLDHWRKYVPNVYPPPPLDPSEYSKGKDDQAYWSSLSCVRFSKNWLDAVKAESEFVQPEPPLVCPPHPPTHRDPKQTRKG